MSESRDSHLHIGILIYPRMDQIDFTGPFEVFSRLPDATVHVIGKTKEPFRDMAGLTLTPDELLSEAPELDVLQIPGGPGQEALMDDQEVLTSIRRQVDAGRFLYSVCTGALICGAAGVLHGRRVTTHWAAHALLPYFGAIPVNARVVVDGKLISAAGVTAGIDGALTMAALLRGEQVAQQIQLAMEYAPDPPFHAGTPASAPPEVLAVVARSYRKLVEARTATAERIKAQHEAAVGHASGAR